MGKAPRGRGGVGVDKDPGISFGAFLTVVFLLLIAPIAIAVAGVGAVKGGQEELRKADTAKLESQLEEVPWLYSALEWFREVEIGASGNFLVGVCIFFVVFLTVVLLLAKRLNTREYYGDTENTAYRRQFMAKAERPSVSASSSYSARAYGGSGYGGYEGSSGSEGSKAQPETNPLFRTSKIERGIGERILKDRSGRDVGYLRTDSVSPDKQLMYDASGRHIASIEPDSVHSDSQLLKDDWGRKIAEIKTDWRGDRVLVDKNGTEVGKFRDGRFERHPWYKDPGSKGTEYDDSGSGERGPNNYGECPYCGGPVDASGYCLEECEDADD